MFQRIAILASAQDPAAQLIQEVLLKLYKFADMGEKFDGRPIYRAEDMSKDSLGAPQEILLGTLKERAIFCEYLDHFPRADLILIASQHKSESGAPAFLTHCTGNWASTGEHGGNAREVAYSAGRVLQLAVNALALRNQERGLAFDVSLEATHHGPTSNKVPLAFLELGSTENEWKNEEYAAVVAHALMDVARNINSNDGAQVYVGFGGPHYAPTFTRLARETKICTSHIIPKYFVREITQEQVKQVIERTVEPVTGFLLDWKGLNAEDRAHLLPILNLFHLPILRTDHIFKQSKS